MLKKLICHDSVHICCVIYDIRNNIYQTHTAKHKRNNRWMWLSSYDFLWILLWNVDTGLKHIVTILGISYFAWDVIEDLCAEASINDSDK